MNENKIAVIGAGVMGHGIAHVAALSGYEVNLYDADSSVLDKALNQVRANLDKGVAKGKLTAEDRDQTIENLQAKTDLKESVDDAGLVIEAIPEKLAIKIEFFGKVSRMVSDDTILATNTSSLSIGKIAAASKRPERMLGMHFFNPPHIMTLLELVKAPRTEKQYIERARAVALKMKRDIIEVMDSPGFATSRLGVVLGLEAMRMLEQKVATPEDIDKAMEVGYRHPMGPLRLTDLVGLDTRLNIADYLYNEFHQDQYKAPKILRDLVSQKKLGKKTGEGFYQWEEK